MNSPHATLHPLLRQLDQQITAPRALQTGHAVLDAALHEGGWPLGALTELLSPLPGMGELSLLAPALVQALARPGWLVLVTPPGLPHAPAWQAAGLPPARVLVVKPPTPRDWLWAVDQAARAGQPAVLAWPGRVALADKSLRRLQLAAEEGGGLLVLARRRSAASESSPAALRLALQGAGPALRLQVLKQRGSWGGQPFALPLPLPAAAPPAPKDWLRAPAPSSARPVAVARAG